MPLADALFRGEWEVPLVMGVVLACVAMAVQLRPPRHKRLANWASAFCWIAAAELLLGLALSPRWMLLLVVPAGVVLLVGYAAWLWRRGGDSEDAATPALAMQNRIGYRGRPGSTGKFRGTTFGEGLDTAIDNEGSVDVENSDLK